MNVNTKSVLSHFAFEHDLAQANIDTVQVEKFNVSALGEGLINDTFRVNHPDLIADYVLQRINTHVFPDPEKIMHNISQLAQHFQAAGNGGITVPSVVHTTTGNTLYRDKNDDPWRVSEFVAGTTTHQTLPDGHHAEALGHALGQFHQIASTLPDARLHDTLPGFHIAPAYHESLRAVVQRTGSSATGDDAVTTALQFIERRSDIVHCLEQAKQTGDVRVQITHGDPKLNNFLFNENSITVSAIIDLDTVKPGLIHYDIGDCVRSACNPTGENPESLQQVEFSMEFCSRILETYLTLRAQHMTRQEILLIPSACSLLPLELGMRFLTDHLNGDQYFKTEYPGQNLYRAQIQLELCQQIEAYRKQLDDLCAGFLS